MMLPEVPLLTFSVRRGVCLPEKRLTAFTVTLVGLMRVPGGTASRFFLALLDLPVDLTFQEHRPRRTLAHR